MSEQMKPEQEGNISRDASSGAAEDFVITPFPGQERFVAPLDETPLKEVDTVDEDEPATSMWADAWRTLRKNPLFIISGLLIIFILVVAIFPQLFTKLDPNYCTLESSLNPGSSGHPLGFDQQGCDIYSRVIYGTRTSVSVGILTTLIATLFGGVIGAVAGYYGRWVDALLSRITDIFFAIPLLLGAIVVLQMFRTSSSIWKVVLVLALFGWVSVARITRGSVMETKNLEFNTASTALGSSPMRNLFRHVVSELPGPGDRHRHDLPRRLHRLRGDLELPGHRSSFDCGQLGRRYFDGTGAAEGPSRGAVLPVACTCNHRSRLHHDGRCCERCP